MLGARSLVKMIVVMALLAACGDLATPSPAALRSGGDAEVPNQESARSCTDRDGDGFGAACLRGPDCDDTDARVTDQCRACLRPARGCPCAAASAPVPCNAATDTTADGPEGICRLGQRVCRAGAWSACEAVASTHRYVGAAMPCPGECDPSCRHIVDCHEAADPLPPGAERLATADVAPAVFCPAGTAPGGVAPTCERRPGGPYLRATSTAAWIDACAAPGSSVVLAGADDASAPVGLPFAFSYWGVPYRSVNVSSNGMLQFAAASVPWSNTTLPAPSAPNTVFAFWDDLVLRGGVCVAFVGAAPNRRAVFQWNDAGFYPAPDAATHLTFEVVLSEAGQTTDVLYRSMQGADDRATGASATVGVQEGGGTRFDLVAYNTPGVITAGTGLRWTPYSNAQTCERAVWRRVFQASCPPTAQGSSPTWGRLNFAARVPPGASIRMEVRAAETAAELAGATPIRLPDAPRDAGPVALTTSYDLGDTLEGAQPGLAHAHFVELVARFDPGPDDDLAPALGGVELQYRCLPAESPFRCAAGSECLTAGVCRRGVIACPHAAMPTCVDAGPLPVGTACGDGLVCDGSGACSPCDEGAVCDAGNPCQLGRISCATGAPVCVGVSDRSSGTVCALGAGDYTRGASPFGFIDACALPGATVALPVATDDTLDLTLPFAFRFYGTPYTQVGAAVNGLLAFPSAPADWTNGPLPAAGLGDAILPFWDDLQTRPSGLCVGSLGRAPERLFLVEWAGVDLEDRGVTGDLGASLQFEVILEESTQAIDVVYGPMLGDARATGASATVGIQRGDGLRYDAVSFNTAGSVRSGSSLRWAPPIASQCDGAGSCVACAAVETCDGRDNNCNALVDEGMGDVTCGVGACRRTGPACVRGVAPACVPGVPSAEVCNGLDDDCDGVVDDACAGTLTCPGAVSMFAGDTRALTVTSAGLLGGFQWTVIAAPPGGDTSARWAPSPATEATERFQPLIVGVYRVRVSAVDGLGVTRSCAFDVTANARGVRAELTWDGPGDVDLHLVDNATATRWFGPDDCHYANMRPAFGAALVVDNVSGNGPENIRVDAPPTGASYTLGVHHYARAAGRVATVRVYCGASGTTPAAVYTSRPLAGTTSGDCSANTFWRVARVVVRADGGCDLAPLDTFTPSATACSGL
jgi:hypothetical protein